jgi:pSer/pThr/pTyr-binding forkhead associated (FHA) protein
VTPVTPQVPVLGTLVIGRGEHADVSVDDEYVSTRHAILRAYADRRLTVEDLGSINGTTVNGVPVSGERELRRGDVLRVGRTDIPWAQR